MLRTSWRRARGATDLFALVFALACGGSGGAIVNSGGGPTTPQGPTVAGLRFSTQPSGSVAGQNFVVAVELIASSGARVTTASDVVAITASGGAAITGQATTSATAGLATFTLALITAGSFTLTASGAGYSASSSSFAVTAASVSGPQSTVQSNPTSLTTNTAAILTFTFKDSYGNAEASVPVSLSTTWAGSSFTPSSGTTTSSGTFVAQFVTSTAGSPTISATVGGTTIAFTGFSVTASSDPCAPVTQAYPGVISGNITSSSCTIGGYRGVVYRVTVSGSSVPPVRYVVSSATFAPLVDLLAVPLQNGGNIVGVLSVPGTISPIWAVPPGTYDLRIRSRDGGTGAFTATGTAVSGNAGAACTVEYLLVSVTTNAGLETDDCQFSGGGWYFDEYDLYSTLPCTITMTSSAYAALFSIRDPSGNTISDNRASGAGATASASLASCSSGGTYIRILATSSSAGFTGNYTLGVTFQGQAAAMAAVRETSIPR